MFVFIITNFVVEGQVERGADFTNASEDMVFIVIFMIYDIC